jgi:lipopolysaccharide export system permease protein
MFKILDRYILWAFITNYIIAMGVMIGLYVILDLFVNLDEFTSVRSAGTLEMIKKIVDFYSYNLLVYFSQLAGIITLVAGCFTFGRLQRTNELTAILASGTSLYRVATPVILASLLMNGLWFIDQELLIPKYADKLVRRHSDIEGREAFAVWFQPDKGNTLVSANMFQPRLREMRGVIIMRRDANDRLTEVIQADQARWDEEQQNWQLGNGSLMKLGSTSSPAGSGALGQTPIRVYDSVLTPKELALQQATMWINFLSLRELNSLQERFPGGSSELVKARHKRLTTVLINMIMLCLGIPFFLTRERLSVIIVGGRCLLMCGLCYVFTFLCQSVDLSVLGVDPAFPEWLPVIVFLPVSAVLMSGIKT